MPTVGIIAEYNPFHSGHLYHLLECGFAAIDYNETVVQGIKVHNHGMITIPHSIGISKKRTGMSKRTGIMRNWVDEQEIRFVVVLDSLAGSGRSFHNWEKHYSVDGDEIPYKRMAVSFTEDAFDKIEIICPPGSSYSMNGIRDRVSGICPKSTISICNSS